jgi:hypothetical protein
MTSELDWQTQMSRASFAAHLRELAQRPGVVGVSASDWLIRLWSVLADAPNVAAAWELQLPEHPTFQFLWTFLDATDEDTD